MNKIIYIAIMLYLLGVIQAFNSEFTAMSICFLGGIIGDIYINWRTS